MDRTDLLDGILGNSTSKLKQATGLKTITSATEFYRPPARTGDLIDKGNFANINFGKVFLDEFYIAPSKARLDKLVNQSLNQINSEIGTIALDKLPDSNAILSDSLGKILKDFAAEGTANGLKRRLQIDNKTGILIQVAKKLNASKLDAITRSMLSRKNIYIYTAFRAVKGLGVSDMEGIVSGITESISKVKAELNSRLAKKVIALKNLKASDEFVQKIQAKLAEREISYAPGAIEPQVLEVYNTYKESEGILSMINEFLDSDVVHIPEDMDREEVIERMLDFLLEIGFVDEEEIPDPNPQPQPQPEIPKDHFEEAIVGIGDERERVLYENEIFTYGQLAAATPEKLKEILPGVITDDSVQAIIEQARLINLGEFKDLLALQDQIKNKAV